MKKKRKWNRAREWAVHNSSGHDRKPHPAYVYKRSGQRRRFLCFTHSRTTKGRQNEPLKHNVDPQDPENCYLVPRHMEENQDHLKPAKVAYRIHPDDRATVRKYEK